MSHEGMRRPTPDSADHSDNTVMEGQQKVDFSALLGRWHTALQGNLQDNGRSVREQFSASELQAIREYINDQILDMPLDQNDPLRMEQFGRYKKQLEIINMVLEDVDQLHDRLDTAGIFLMADSIFAARKVGNNDGLKQECNKWCGKTVTIKKEDYTLMNVLGVGGQGVVFQVTSATDGMNYALKLFRAQDRAGFATGSGGESLKSAILEAGELQRLSNRWAEQSITTTNGQRDTVNVRQSIKPTDPDAPPIPLFHAAQLLKHPDQPRSNIKPEDERILILITEAIDGNSLRNDMRVWKQAYGQPDYSHFVLNVTAQATAALRWLAEGRKYIRHQVIKSDGTTPGQIKELERLRTLAHHDVKPDNIILDYDAEGDYLDFRLMLLDFGAAEAIEYGTNADGYMTVNDEHTPRHLQRNHFVGTPRYIPEFASDGIIAAGDTRDIGALGTIVLEMTVPPNLAEQLFVPLPPDSEGASLVTPAYAKHCRVLRPDIHEQAAVFRPTDPALAQLFDLAMKMVSRYPGQRPNYDTILETVYRVYPALFHDLLGDSSLTAPTPQSADQPPTVAADTTAVLKRKSDTQR